MERVGSASPCADLDKSGRPRKRRIDGMGRKQNGEEGSDASLSKGIMVLAQEKVYIL